MEDNLQEENNFCPNCGADLRAKNLCSKDEIDEDSFVFGCCIIILIVYIGMGILLLFSC